MSEKLRRATTAVFFVFFSVVLYLQFVKPVASLSFFVFISLYVIVASFVTYLAIKRLEVSKLSRFLFCCFVFESFFPENAGTEACYACEADWTAYD